MKKSKTYTVVLKGRRSDFAPSKSNPTSFDTERQNACTRACSQRVHSPCIACVAVTARSQTPPPKHTHTTIGYRPAFESSSPYIQSLLQSWFIADQSKDDVQTIDFVAIFDKLQIELICSAHDLYCLIYVFAGKIGNEKYK